MKKNYKLLATLVLSGLAGAAFGVLPAEAAVTVRSADGTETSLTKTEFTSLYGNTYTDSTSGNTVSISGEGTVTLKGETVSSGGSSYTDSTLAGAYAYTLESGDASNNKLSVTDGASVSFSNAMDNWIAGGRSLKGAASGNQVTLSGVSLNLPDATTSSLEIAGGVTGRPLVLALPAIRSRCRIVLPRVRISTAAMAIWNTMAILLLRLMLLPGSIIIRSR